MLNNQLTNELISQLIENLSGLKTLQIEALLLKAGWFEDDDIWYLPNADPLEHKGYELETAYELLKMRYTTLEERKSGFQKWSEKQLH